MGSTSVFHPPVRRGTLYLTGAILTLSAVGVLGLWQVARASVGPSFLFYLIPSLFCFGMVPFLAYRIYSLRGASYQLERDGIHIQWGLRGEVIPMDIIAWVYLERDLDFSLPLPRLRWPGSIIGSRRLPDRTFIEYLAAEKDKLVFIATPGRVFGISPESPEAFLLSYQRLSELGSLAPLKAGSVYPAVLLSRFWSDRIARGLLLGGLLLSLVLFLWVSIAIPGRTQVTLRLSPDGIALEQVPSVRLYLLPVLNSLFFAADALLGLFFYRRIGNPGLGEVGPGLQAGSVNVRRGQALAYLLWGSGLVTPLLFLIAVLFILQAR